MLEKFKLKYRIESARLKDWDYSSPGIYFVTICTRNRECFFGEIKKSKMVLNNIGKIAENCWSEIPRHFQNVELGESVIMPNHVHGIIIINNRSISENMQSQSPPPNQTHFRFRNQGKKTISAMVGSFKSAVSKLVRPINKNFGWQSRFHDHIIRTQDEYTRISNYIKDNPINWNNDKFYKQQENMSKVP